MQYLFRRLIIVPFLLLGVATVVFVLFQFTPGDPLVGRFGLQINNMSPETLERMRNDLGLNDPVFVQYARYMGNLLRGDLGTSITTRAPVLEEIMARSGATLELALVSFCLIVVCSIPLGMLAALKRGTLIDRIMMGGALFGFSVPAFWLGTMLILLFAIQFKLFPTSGRGEGLLFERWQYLVLPSLTVSLGAIGYNSRIVRSAILEVVNQMYITTARSKGLHPRRVLFRHLLPNALLPIVTLMGLQFAALLAGAAIIETIFAWPGMGRLAINAIGRRDYPLILGTTLIFSVVYILTNLVVDLLYMVIDPRIRLG
ncbi:MAG: ABC transporter permease [Chloroflexi bacterium]|uniref:ABC transporter permease n=1 Tax=Candidatus Flexifilum breve TaxID=3140694 RepID=UPI003134B90B|nr:ABC transporter permease [Chloroflexota bacterium]MBK9745322.1 ABC transporter permease [Chloroflexota bacterium]